MSTGKLALSGSQDLRFESGFSLRGNLLTFAVPQTEPAQSISTIHPIGIPGWADWGIVDDCLPSEFYAQSGPDTMEYTLQWVKGSLEHSSALDDISTVAMIMLVIGLALRDVQRLGSWTELGEEERDRWPIYVKTATKLDVKSLESRLENTCDTLYTCMKAARR